MTASADAEVNQSWEQYLRASAVPREVIDAFLQRPNWAAFDPELGYILHDSFEQNGMTAAAPSRRSGRTARARGSSMRVASRGSNAYGNSFTECRQVSDGETWQEYLAAHFGEPVGNFGVANHGVYQAYRRMRRVERTDDGAQYVILYVWGDDPVRSLMRCRWGQIYPWFTQPMLEQRRFHGNPWARVEIDLETGSFVELENPLPTPESLYSMCDPEWMAEHLRGDLATQLAVFAGDSDYAEAGKIGTLDRPAIGRLAEVLDVPFDWSADADQRRQAAMLLNRYGQRAAIFILDQARAFTRGAGKELIVILNCTARTDQFGGSSCHMGRRPTRPGDTESL